MHAAIVTSRLSKNLVTSLIKLFVCCVVMGKDEVSEG
jgi:hypothetical protein